MIIPIMKKEIHLRLLKRAVIGWLIALIISLLIVLLLEYRYLGRNLLVSAAKESAVFASIISIQQKNPEDFTPETLKKMVGYSLDQTSFIMVELLDAMQSELISFSTSSATSAAERFTQKGVQLLPSDRIDGSWLLLNKRIYQKVIIPLYDANENRVGYIRGIYLVSLTDTKHIITRFVLSSLLCLAAVTVCSVFCYFGYLFMNNHLIRSIGELNRTTLFLIKKLGESLAKSDRKDRNHNYRTLIYAMTLAETAKLSLEQKRTLIHGVFLHDLGMLPTSTDILHKEDELDEEAFKEISQHPKLGGNLVRKFRWLRNAEQVIRFHHEKYDGSGYPDGARHEKIPMIARVFSIADAFDALTSDRPYQDARSLEESLDALEMETGTQFDPVLLASFLEIAPELHKRVTTLKDKGLEKEADKILKKYLKYK